MLPSIRYGIKPNAFISGIVAPNLYYKINPKSTLQWESGHWAGNKSFSLRLISQGGQYKGSG